MGIRETRHFKGLYTLCEDDILTARQFDGWVVRGAHFNFDVHNLTGARTRQDRSSAQVEAAERLHDSVRLPDTERVDGLILSGRNISGTHIAHSNYRVMPICRRYRSGCRSCRCCCRKDKIDSRASFVPPSCSNICDFIGCHTAAYFCIGMAVVV